MSLYRDRYWILQVFIGGLILLVCPPLGWMLAMGYRKAFGRAYVESVRNGTAFIWPEWRSNFTAMFIDGVKAWCVIMSYLLPSFALGWGMILMRSGIGPEQGIALALFAGACTLLLPVGLPAAIVGFSHYYPWFTLCPWEAVVTIIVFLVGVFLIPSGFIRVSFGAGFADALPIGNGWRLVFKKPVAYGRAWALAIAYCLGALFLGPFAPFGIFWSYQITVKLFADVGIDRPEEDR